MVYLYDKRHAKINLEFKLNMLRDLIMQYSHLRNEEDVVLAAGAELQEF